MIGVSISSNSVSVSVSGSVASVAVSPSVTAGVDISVISVAVESPRVCPGKGTEPVLLSFSAEVDTF